MTACRFGRLAPHPEETHPRLHLGDYLTSSLPEPPASVDWYSRVTSWPMALNDQIGDCTEAMVCHLVEGASTYGAGTTEVISDADVLAAYERVSGYNPDDPSTDQGAVLQDVYGDWMKNGVGGHKNLCYAQVDHTSQTEVKQAIDLFGAVGLGITVTQDMMDAFNAGQPWTTATGSVLGGHAVPAVGFDDQNVNVVTWAKVQPMTWDCYKAVTEESWAAVLPEWLNSAGQDPQGLDLRALGSDFADLTGGTNPFPAPTPQPTPPSPTPEPTPIPEPAPAPDPSVVAEFVAFIKTKAAELEHEANHVIHEIVDWAKTHGL